VDLARDIGDGETGRALKAGPGDALLRAEGIGKTFDSTRALIGASIDLRAGEVHGLLGSNGAGKSTLSKIISGHVTRDSGAIVYRGRPVNHRSTREALEAGIAIVMQETSLAPDLSVLENIFLPELGRPGRLSRASMRRRATDVLAGLGREHILPLDAEVGRLSAAQRQLVEIAKALALESDLIIFDEPTASLSPSEVERLFDIMARLRDAGRALVFVSHRLEEVFAITDRVTILREGSTVLASRETATLDQAEMISHMAGRDIGAIHASAISATGADSREIAFEVTGVSAPPAVRDVSFSVRRGEILGLGGLVGAGRSETAEAIFGLRRRAGGTIRLAGRVIAPRKPVDAIRAGIGFVPEDRRVQNIVPDLSVRENLLLAHLGARRGFGLGYGARRERVDALLGELDLPAHRLLDASMLNFSGGMQQKIIIARWLLLAPKVLILDEPTKGVDIGARQSIYAILRRVAQEGAAVVVISSDFEELLGLCERIVVVSDGRSIADLPSATLDEGALTLLAAPRTSMARNAALLDRLTAEFGGAAFWALLDGERLICLNLASPTPDCAPGFAPGEARRFAQTRIAPALAARATDFTASQDGGMTAMLTQVSSRRGHDLGWIGLCLPADAPRPAAARVREMIEAFNAEDT